MESTLKKPLDIFDSGNAIAPATKGFAPPSQPQMRKKTLKESMNERAEQMFLEPDLYGSEDDADLFRLADEARDPQQKRPKTALERYYDRLDRNLTNNAATQSGSPATSDLTETRDPLERSSLNPFGDLMPNQSRKETAVLNPLVDRKSETGMENWFSQGDEKSVWTKPVEKQNKPVTSIPENNWSSFSGFRQQKENTRLDDFKQLLASPHQTSSDGASIDPYGGLVGSIGSGGYSSQPTPAANRVSAPVVTPGEAKPQSGLSFVPTYNNVPSYNKVPGLSSVTTLPTVTPDSTANTGLKASAVQKPPKSEFKIPRRQF